MNYDIIKDISNFIKDATLFISKDKYIGVKEYDAFLINIKIFNINFMYLICYNFSS